MLFVIYQDIFIDDRAEFRKAGILIIILLAGTLLYLYSGIDSLKGPAAITMFEVVLWALLGVWMFKTRVSVKSLFPVILLVCFGLATGLGLTNILGHVDYSNAEVDITKLLDSQFQRSTYVDENNMAKFKTGDPYVDNAYSAILGANIYYTNKDDYSYLGFNSYALMDRYHRFSLLDAFNVGKSIGE